MQRQKREDCRMIRRMIMLAALLFFVGCRQQEPAVTPLHLAAVIVQEYPHDQAAFTQGLAWDKGTVYESTGLNGQSSLRRVDLASGKVLQQRDYGSQFFAEGLTIFGENIYQLTWRNGVIFQYEKESFALRRTSPWPNEGWGITHDGSNLIISDGSSALYFLDPASMTEQRRITVRDQGQEIDRLNELEYIKGSIYANVWHEERIAVISPANGTVTAWIDLSAICARMRSREPEAVLNGIMYDSASDRLFVTGKLWPVLFAITTVPAQRNQP